MDPFRSGSGVWTYPYDRGTVSVCTYKVLAVVFITLINLSVTYKISGFTSGQISPLGVVLPDQKSRCTTSGLTVPPRVDHGRGLTVPPRVDHGRGRRRGWGRLGCTGVVPGKPGVWTEGSRRETKSPHLPSTQGPLVCLGRSRVPEGGGRRWRTRGKR